MSSRKDQTRKEYIKRINEVQDFVEKHLDKELSLQFLSEKAHYSSFHFHRIFSAIVGEPLNEYVVRKRLERIGGILITDAKASLKELAYAYGFSSENSFSRTFKKYYGVSPSQFKLQGEEVLSKIGVVPITMRKYVCGMEKHMKWIEKNARITIETLPEISVVAISCMGQFEEMGRMFEKLFAWGAKKEITPGSEFRVLTIYHDNPHVTEASKVRFSACISIEEEVEAEEEIRPLTVTSGTYAVGRFEIEAQEFQQAWDSMCVWVVEEGLRFRDADYFEVYLNDHRFHPEGKFIVDICIPVETESHKENRKKGENTSRKKYGQLMDHIHEIRNYFGREYASNFTLGNLYKGSVDYTYFSLKPPELKEFLLKFVLIYNHLENQFEICLSGQNKKVRRNYWEMFRESDWNSYHLAESIDDSLSIMDHVIVENPQFEDMPKLIKEIEKEVFKFMDSFRGIFN